MRRIVLIALIFLSPSVFGSNLQVWGILRVLEPSSGEQKPGTIQTLSEFEIRRGNYEHHAREWHPNYRGIPWNLVVELDDETQNARVTFWIDGTDLRFDESDEPIISDEFPIGELEPRHLRLLGFPDGSLLQLTLVPRTIPEALRPAPLRATEDGLTRFCLKHTKVLMDDTFVLGSVTGFGEKIVLEIPEMAVVNMSMQRLHEWPPIGTYEDGVIDIPMPGGHQLSLTGVRIGPTGSDLGGPYLVYGSIKPSQSSLTEMRDRVEERLKQQHSGDRLMALIEAFRANPFGTLSRITVGNDRETSEQLERKAGSFGQSLEACSVSD
jgi:hypothetical protein